MDAVYEGHNIAEDLWGDLQQTSDKIRSHVLVACCAPTAFRHECRR